MFQIQSPEIKHLTTAHLAQTMSLLGLTISELRQKIEAELSKNPALELVDERRCPSCRRKLVNPGPCPVCSQQKSSQADDPIVFLSDRQEYHPGSYVSSEGFPDDNFAPEVIDLPRYILRQIAAELEESDRPIAAHILTSLDDDGLLTISHFEIARYHHVSLERVKTVLQLIQRADPIGVASSSPQEAMLVQLKSLSEQKKVPALAEQAIHDGIDLLSRRQYSELAKLLGTSLKNVREIAHFVSDNLNPFPGRAHWGDIHQGRQKAPSVFSQPDIVMHLLDKKNTSSPLVVEILMPMRGTLRIDPLFRAALQEADPEKLDEWKSDIEQATLLIKCIQQRNNTMRRLAFLLSKYQRKFILKGEAHLIPMTRVELADQLGVHESTVSRAVSSKTIQLPSGRIIPMDQLFDRSLHIRTALKKIVDSERKALTDTQLAARLKEQGHPVARRTVAKYRAMEGILPARLRQATREAA